MLIAALRRRRAGFLAFTAIVSTVAMLTATAGASIMPQGALVAPGTGISLDHSQRLVQPFGDAYMFAFPTGADDIPVIELTQGTGDTWLTIDENARVALDATDAGTVNVVSVGPDGTMTQVESMPTGRCCSAATRPSPTRAAVRRMCGSSCAEQRVRAHRDPRGRTTVTDTTNPGDAGSRDTSAPDTTADRSERWRRRPHHGRDARLGHRRADAAG